MPAVHAIRIHAHGGPEVLRWEALELREPGLREARVRQTAVGLNYIDTYHRTGLYPVELPAILGREAAGIVEAVGPGTVEVHEGDRVAYALHPGAYAESQIVPESCLVPLPPEIGDRTAAAMMLKGLTAHYLLRRTHHVAAGEVILIHAAAGGVGSIACQWAKHLGATVIGTVGSEEKRELARAHGCDHVLLYRQEDVPARVRDITRGRGVRVVYDSVGQATFDQSLDCLAPLGLLVSFGQSSGPVAPFDIGRLAQKGSLFLARPTLATYIAKREELLSAARELFAVVRSDTVRIEIGQTYPLREAERAHRDLEGRRTTGSTLLIP